MQLRWAALLLAFLGIGVCVPGPVAAQSPTTDGAFFLEWQGASNGTLVLDANGVGKATFRVGFQPPAHSGSCIGGSMVSIPLDAGPVPPFAQVSIDPTAVSLPGDHVPNAGTPATRWSEPVSFSTRWEVNQIPVGTSHRFTISTGTGMISGGSCTPAVPSTPTGARLDLNASLGPPSAATPMVSSPHPVGAPGWALGVAAVLAALSFRRRPA